MRAALLSLALLAGHAAPAIGQIFPLDTLRVAVGARAGSALPSAARSVQVLDRASIEATPAQSVSDLLAWALGVDVLARSAAQADLEIRGSSFEGVLVLVDGVRMSDTQTGHFDLDTAVPLAEIERIEILRGPASAQYGSDAMGGVIQIVTRRDASVEARLEGGTFATFGGAASAGFGGVRLGVEHRGSDGDREGTDYRITQIRGGARTPLGTGTLQADLAWAGRDFGAADFYAPFPSYEETRTLTASGGWSGDVGRVTLQPRLHARRHHDDFILRRGDPGFYRNMHRTWQYGAELTGRVPVGERAVLAAGLEGTRDEIDSNALGDRAESRGALFSEVVLGGPAAMLQVGARLDHHTEYGSFFAPSVAGAVRVAPRVRLRASAGRSFRAPGWTERYYEDPANIGTPDLDPERAWSIETGAALAVTDAVRLDIAGFARFATDLIDWAKPAGADDGDPWHTMNVDDATFVGLETALQADWIGARWSASAMLLSLDAGEAEGFVSKYALRPLERQYTGGVDAPLPHGLRFAVRARHARRAGEDGYSLFDARLSWTVGTLRVDLDGTNLTNEEYLDVSVQPAPGRAVRIGLVYHPR